MGYSRLQLGQINFPSMIWVCISQQLHPGWSCAICGGCPHSRYTLHSDPWESWSRPYRWQSYAGRTNLTSSLISWCSLGWSRWSGRCSSPPRWWGGSCSFRIWRRCRWAGCGTAAALLRVDIFLLYLEKYQGARLDCGLVAGGVSSMKIGRYFYFLEFWTIRLSLLRSGSFILALSVRLINSIALFAAMTRFFIISAFFC